ncbi:hypothetical protein N431DRAFT_525161, partial [Stipitochalara longipes BDJ]
MPSTASICCCGAVGNIRVRVPVIRPTRWRGVEHTHGDDPNLTARSSPNAVSRAHECAVEPDGLVIWRPECVGGCSRLLGQVVTVSNPVMSMGPGRNGGDVRKEGKLTHNLAITNVKLVASPAPLVSSLLASNRGSSRPNALAVAGGRQLDSAGCHCASASGKVGQARRYLEWARDTRTAFARQDIMNVCGDTWGKPARQCRLTLTYCQGPRSRLFLSFRVLSNRSDCQESAVLGSPLASRSRFDSSGVRLQSVFGTSLPSPGLTHLLQISHFVIFPFCLLFSSVLSHRAPDISPAACINLGIRQASKF